jgi:PPK2 family polyphosphate:nucleotide phosphotransferase
MSTLGERWRVPPGKKFALGKVDTGSTADAPGDKDSIESVVWDLGEELIALQERLWAEGKQSLLIVLQAMDTGGKDGTIKHVFRGLNPQGVRVASFKAPSEVELHHDFLWRIHDKAPANGEMVIFNRSHYEDVLIVRVHSLVPEAVWRARYDAIADFERHLVESGTTIVKFWLHISPAEQKRRLQARLDDPTKRWKFKAEDLDERKLWVDYQAAAEEMLQRTSTEHAPWFVVPGDHKWYRNWVVSRVLVDTLAAMDPQFPDPPDLQHCEIPDM